MTARRKSRREVLKALAPTGRRAEMPTNLRAEVQKITPHMAQVWLEGKTPNRSVSDNLVERFRRDMVAGAWHLNGEPIIFDEDGALMDGQHRLWAIVFAEVAVTMLVVTGAKSASMETFDTGRARTFQDALRIRGKHNQSIIAAACRWLYWYDNSAAGATYNAGVGSPTHYELSRTLAANPTVEMAADMIGRRKATRVLSPGILGFVVSGAIKRDPEKAAAFLEQLGNGLELTDTSPIYHLRNKAEGNKKGSSKIKLMVLAAYTMKAWNAFYKDRPMRNLKWQTDGDKPEPFPRFED